MEESLNVYRISVWKPEGNSPLGKPRRRWKDINMRLQEISLESVTEWCDSGLGQVVDYCTSGDEPSGSIQ